MREGKAKGIECESQGTPRASVILNEVIGGVQAQLSSRERDRKESPDFCR